MAMLNFKKFKAKVYGLWNAESQAAVTFSVDKQEEAVPLLFPQPQVYILVNACKLQIELAVK